MSKKYRSSDLYLKEMIGACIKIQEYVANTTEEEFLKQRESFDAICMQFAHLGEQVDKLKESDDRVIQHYPDDVDWAGLNGLRNRIDHNYTGVDADMIWSFAMNEMEGIEGELRRILKKRFGQSYPLDRVVP